MRRAIVEADKTSLNITEFCRSHGVSTWFFHDLRRRHAREGDVVLEPKSRAPKRVANRTPADIEDQIVGKRKELEADGWDAGPASIAAYLSDLEGLPSESTIWRILRDRGLITPEPKKAPKAALGTFTAQRVNECWAFDDWEWSLADGTIVKVFDVLDDHSRYAVAVTAMPHCTGAACVAALLDAAQWVGLPERFWTDNAKAFRHTVADALAVFDVVASHTRPRHPHSNGKAERFHQTVQLWLSKQSRATTVAELQHQLDLFRLHYNTLRPHRALNRACPADVWHAAPKTGPIARPVDQITTVHHSHVTGGICNAGRYRISIGAIHNQQRALTIITGTRAHVFVNGQLARQLDINPDQQHQTLHTRRGRPTKTTP